MQEVETEILPEIGYLIHYPYWRNGYASEAALRIKEYAFKELGYKKVISLIRPVNIPSQGVAKKLGMKPERECQFKGKTHIIFMIENEIQ